jgi:hypothetical protein
VRLLVYWVNVECEPTSTELTRNAKKFLKILSFRIDSVVLEFSPGDDSVVGE